MSAGIALQQEDPVARGKAAHLALQVALSPDWQLPWAQTLFLAPGLSHVPWTLIPAGFRFLQRGWDAAAPFLRPGVLAAELGTPAERKRTAAVALDLRVPLYEPGLLFVRDSKAGRALVATWRQECAGGADEKLAFLRALCRVKPAFCVLPYSWLAEEQLRAQQDARSRHGRVICQPQALVQVELSPGRFVKCRPGEEEAVKRHYEQLMHRRAEKQR